MPILHQNYVLYNSEEKSVNFRQNSGYTVKLKVETCEIRKNIQKQLT